MITPAFAQAAGAGGSTDMLISLVPFVLIFVIFLDNNSFAAPLPLAESCSRYDFFNKSPHAPARLLTIFSAFASGGGSST